MVIAIASLAVGVIVGFLGIRGAVASYQREQGLEQYRETNVSASSVGKIGARAEEVARKLSSLDEERATVFRKAERAFLAGDLGRYNQVVQRQNALATKANVLLMELDGLVDGLPAAPTARS
jgi:hypothetical protein